MSTKRKERDGEWDARETLFADEKVDETFRVGRFPLELREYGGM